MADARQVKIESEPEATDDALVQKLEQQLEGAAEEEIQEVRPYRASGAKHGSAG